MNVHRLALATVFLLAGCAGRAADEALPPTHPASPAAAEAAPYARSQTLALPDSAPPAAPPGQSAVAEPTHAGHDGHRGYGMGGGESSPNSDHSHHDLDGSESGTPPATTQPVTYTCPHHPEVVSDRPGECPKCHMDLEKKGGEGA